MQDINFIHFVYSDSPDPELSHKIGSDHFVSLPDCSKNYEQRMGNCKVGHMYDFFMSDERCSSKKWWCKFDDDAYVNAGRLAKVYKTMNSVRMHFRLLGT